MNDLYQFLHNHRTEDRPTHVSLFPKGKYLIPSQDREQFWKLYNYYYTVEPLGLAETQTSVHIPVLVDVDLKVEDNEESLNEPLYSDKHVEHLVRAYQKVLGDILQNARDADLVCLLLEKPPYRLERHGKSYYKNGYHLQFPRVFMTRYQQEHILLPRIRMEIKKLKEGDYPSCIPAENMIDRGYCKGAGQPWLLYGSRKEAGMNGYSISKAYEVNGNTTEEWWRFFMDSEIDGVLLRTREEVENHLPQLLSIQLVGNRSEYIFELKPDVHPTNWDKPTSLFAQQLQKTKKTPVGGSSGPGTSTSAVVTATTGKSNDADLSDLVEKLLSLLSCERYEDRNEWIRVGWILYNIFQGGEEGFKHWIRFSKQSDIKFNESVCQYEWMRMQKKDLTIGSLKYLSKLDNPSGYREVMKNAVKPYIERCLKLDGAHNDLAMILYQKYDYEFTCASITQKMWYQFRDHIWQKSEEGVELRKKISSDLVVEYDEIAKSYLQSHLTCQDEDESKALKKKVASAMKMISRLKTSPYKTNVMKEAMELFYDEWFLKKLDANPYLIAFQNGIYDLKQHEFRDGSPNDYISLKMKINYNRYLTINDEAVKQVIQYFEKIFPDVEVREYFLNTASDLFIGGNFNKIVQVWTGEGDNGKSITQSIFEQMLGPYAVKLPTALIVGKRTQSSAACPELVRAGNGVRFAVLQEPDQKDTINIGILKELSGNDTFFARGLFKEGAEISPMFKLVLICNELPNLHNSDRATWNRIRVVPFESTFSDDAPATFEEQLQAKVFPKDPQFKDKIPDMLEALAWLLLERLKTKPKILVEPEKVVRATEHYKKKNDIFRLFADEFVDANPEKQVQVLEMYSTFKDWFRESYPNSHIPSKVDLREYFSKKWGDPIGQIPAWKGYCIRSNFEI